MCCTGTLYISFGADAQAYWLKKNDFGSVGVLGFKNILPGTYFSGTYSMKI
jgi:hypothetical protein